MQKKGLYIVLISVHGLIRAREPELGRDADTGGQVLYVLELARHLAQHPAVEKVELMTRLVHDAKVDKIYSQRTEEICPGASIVRLECGPKRYLRKEVLWPHLDRFVDNAIQHIRERGEIPDIIHSHYADAGYVGVHLSSLLGVPHVHTGHSLGRVKYKQLMEKGSNPYTIEQRYHFSERVEAEELTLDSAALVVASSSQEINEQYRLYDNYNPQSMRVIPPGIDLTRFMPTAFGAQMPRYMAQLQRFLEQPRRPIILAMSRADERKNVTALVKAYADDADLQEIANLVLILGNRDHIDEMEPGTRKILRKVIAMIDDYDLYGKVAYPKHHQSSDVPEIYQLAAHTKGVFVNPALTEPFGLTIIEASASGVPVVATRDGGPVDIIGNCNNGILINPLDTQEIAESIKRVLTDRKLWKRYAKNGINGTRKYYSWPGHVESYVKAIRRLFDVKAFRKHLPNKSRLPTVNRLAISSLDNTLIGDKEALDKLIMTLNKRRSLKIGYGIATGRNLESTLRELRSWSVPVPDILIVAVGSEIYYTHEGRHRVADSNWRKHIDYRWERDKIRSALDELSGLRYRGKNEQGDFKISYFLNPVTAPTVRQIKAHLRQNNLHANVIISNNSINLDVLPIRASKGQAVRYLALKWGIPLNAVFTAGDSGNDLGMLSGDMLSVVVANHSDELERLRESSGIYYSDQAYAYGILDGLEHFGFLEPELAHNQDSIDDNDSADVFIQSRVVGK